MRQRCREPDRDAHILFHVINRADGRTDERTNERTWRRRRRRRGCGRTGAVYAALAGRLCRRLYRVFRVQAKSAVRRLRGPRRASDSRHLPYVRAGRYYFRERVIIATAARGVQYVRDIDEAPSRLF